MIIKTRALRAAALVSLAMPLCACTVTSVKSETHAGLAPDHIERTTGDVKLSDASLATSALQSGDVSLASSLYAKTLEQHPNDVDALIGMGTTLADAGDFERARETYRHAIAVAPKRTEPVLELARLDLRQRRLDEAIALYRQLLSREPASRFASAGLGTAYAVKGEARAAQETFEAALRAHPGDVMLTIDLGLSYVLDGQVRKGANLLLDVAGQPGAPTQARQDLALAYGLLGNNDAADKVLTRDLPRKSAEDNVAFYKVVRAKLQSLPGGVQIATLPPAKEIGVRAIRIPMTSWRPNTVPALKAAPLEAADRHQTGASLPAAEQQDALLTPQAMSRAVRPPSATDRPSDTEPVGAWTLRRQAPLLDRQ